MNLGFAQTVLQPVQQVLNGPLLCFHGVFVGRHAIAGDQVRLPRQSLRDIAVEIHRGRYEHVLSDDLADAGQEVAFRIVEAYHAHGTVDVEEEPVEGQHGFETLEDFPRHALVGVPGYDAAGDGASPQGRQPGRSIPIGRVIGQEGVRCEHLFTAGDPESVDRRLGGRERRRLDGDSGDGDPGTIVGPAIDEFTLRPITTAREQQDHRGGQR